MYHQTELKMFKKSTGAWRQSTAGDPETNSNYTKKYYLEQNHVVYTYTNGFRNLFVGVCLDTEYPSMPEELRGRRGVSLEVILTGSEPSCIRVANGLISSEDILLSKELLVETQTISAKMLSFGLYINDERYNTMTEIAEEFEISVTAVANRIKSPAFMSWRKIMTRDGELIKDLPERVWSTPKGRFISSRVAAEFENVSRKTIERRTKDPQNLKYKFESGVFPTK